MMVDIIIPAYNALYLEEAIDSCVKQSYPDIKITVVDNQSPKDIKAICDKFPNINYLKSPQNNGPAGGRNWGIKHTHHPLISFLDDDDIMEKDKVSLSVQEFQQDPTLGMTCGNYQILLNRKNFRPPFYKKDPIINWANLIRQNFVASGSVTIKRSVVEEVGLFDERFWIAEDYDCWLKVSEKYPIKYIPKVLYYYSWINGSDSLTKRPDIQKNHMPNLSIIREESKKRVKSYGKNIPR